MIHEKIWRLNNFYRIIDKNSDSIPFKLNVIQSRVASTLHTRNLICKPRQIGMSTMSVLYLLDEVLWSENLNAGIVSYSLEHAQHIFKKIIGHALDTMPKPFMPYLGIKSRSAREITFQNGGSIRVDTSLRGGSYPLTLISEFGKTCARNPQKAEEVVTGTIQAVPINGRLIIESTMEGSDGYFADMIQQAMLRGNDNLSALEYKLFFFPWFDDPTYLLEEKIEYDVSLSDYFKEIQSATGAILTEPQRHWYTIQKRTLGEKIKQEFPSTIEEAFLSSSDAYYFSEAIARANKDNRCLHTSLYDALLPVYVAMDIGINDLTVIIFFQLAHGEIRVIDYYEDKNKDVSFYARFLLQDKKYIYHTIFLPHDSVKRDILDISNTFERDFRRLFSHTSTKFHVLKKIDKQVSISHARIKLDRCVFNMQRVKKLVEHLSKYRKKWSEPLGRYLEDPQHDIHSDYSDAYQYLSQAVTHIEAVGNQNNALEKHKEAVASRTKIIR